MKFFKRHSRGTYLALVLILTSTIGTYGPAQATIFFDDSFEGATPEAGGWAYDSSAGCYPIVHPCKYLDVSTDFAHAGSKSLKEYYTGDNDDNDTQAGGIYNAASSATLDMWVRYYIRFGTGYTHSIVYNSKILIFDTGKFYPRFINEIFTDRPQQPGWAVEISADCGYASCNFLPNMATKTLANNVQYCIEQHVKMNSLGVNDGMIEGWVDGVQTVGYYNRQFRGPNAVNPNNNSSNSIFQLIKVYKQHGSALGFPASRYLDQLAMGNTRIGCTGGPSPDSTPPTPPTGLSVR